MNSELIYIKDKINKYLIIHMIMIKKMIKKIVQYLYHYFFLLILISFI